ncbi:MAG: hypothetical protein AAF149_24080 [Bacteroidota bacterium]
MKNSTLRLSLSLLFTFSALTMFAQRDQIQYLRFNDKRGINIFETGKEDTIGFEGVKLRVGGDYALQFQSLDHSNDLAGDTLSELKSNINLPHANMSFDVQLEDGIRVHLKVYLASRHKEQPYVKGGYLQVDKLDFIKPGFLGGIMKVTTLKIGYDEINYGDTHFRRSDGARALYNPFVGNYIMDAFTTEPHFEVTVQDMGFIGVAGISNGKLDQSVKVEPGPFGNDSGIALYGKVGYDKQVNSDLRVRMTGSIYSSTEANTFDHLYFGDRTGGRYFHVMDGENDVAEDDFLPRYNPGFRRQTAYQINPFVKYKGVEFFGVLEQTSNGDDEIGGDYTQLGAELIYRFGGSENLFFGGRFNSIDGENSDLSQSREILRFNVGGGWFLTKNVALKGEYVRQEYDGDGWAGTKFQGGEFDGFMLEAAISF